MVKTYTEFFEKVRIPKIKTLKILLYDEIMLKFLIKKKIFFIDYLKVMRETFGRDMNLFLPFCKTD